MAISKQIIKETYPLPAYNYQVTIKDVEIMSFSEVSGLEIDHEHVLYRHGFSFTAGDHLIRGQRKPINITLKRGILKRRDDLYDWIKSGEKKNIRIELCDEARLGIVVWEVTRALPYKLNAPSFNASGSEVALESLDLIAHDLRIIYN